MEVELRLQGLEYENQRILPIDYEGHIVGESIPDLIVWVKSGKKRIGIVIDLKQDNFIKEDQEMQVQKYMHALQRQLRPNEEVYKKGMVINFPKCSSSKIDQDKIEDCGGVMVSTVMVK